MNKLLTKAFANLIASILFILLGIWAWTQTTGFPYIANTYVQPSVFPRIMIVGLLVFSIVLLVQSIIKITRMKESDELSKRAESLDFIRNKGVRAAGFVILLCIFFVLAFNILGYVLSAMLVSLIIMYMIGKRTWLQMVLVSVLIPLGMWLIFYKVLTVNIPMGPLNFLRVLVDMI